MLERFDQQLFLFINSSNSPFFDHLMYAISGNWSGSALSLLYLFIWVLNTKEKFLIYSDFYNSSCHFWPISHLLLLKNFSSFTTLSRALIIGIVILVNGECGGVYGFVSSHATNCFDVALLSLLFIKKKMVYNNLLFFGRGLLDIGRILPGCSLPSDVICGSFLGAFIGWSMYNLYILTDNNIQWINLF